MSHFKYLFEPLKINSMELKNRIVMCPMGTNLAEESGMPTDQMAAWYGERAKGGTGLIVVEQTVVQPVGKWSKLAAGLWEDKFVAGWKKVVDAVHAHDGKIAIQIGHLGRSTNLENTGGLQPVAPSPVPCHLAQVIPHELTTEEVYQFIDDYMLAVKRAVDAGFDAVEIHGTHGYLIASFMSGKSNKRTDEFGGNLRGRMRLPLEIIRRVRKEVGDDYPVLMRIASVEPKGGRLLEETKAVASVLAQEGLDALDVSAGSFSEVEWEVPPYFFAPGFNLMNIAEIKQSVDIPVICSGLVHEPDMAEQVVKEGRSDMVGIGRALIADPHWANKAREGKFDEIRYCIACTGCIDVLFVGNPIRCTVNPFAGRETESDIPPADKKKKVVVIGGGPAGLQVASIASARGHEVTLLEKHTMLGGQVRAAATPPDKHLMTGIIRALEVEAINNGVAIQLGQEATPEVIRELNPDAVVVATGARPVIPDFACQDFNNIATAEDVLLGRVDTGAEILVLGGGEIGCETAHFLAEYGKSVTIVEMADDIGIEVGFIPRPLLLEKLKQLGVKMIDSTKVDEILNECVIVEQDGTQQKMMGYDNIVLALGYASVNDLYDQIREAVPETYLAGDARTPRNVMATLLDAVDVASQL